MDPADVRVNRQMGHFLLLGNRWELPAKLLHLCIVSRSSFYSYLLYNKSKERRGKKRKLIAASVAIAGPVPNQPPYLFTVTPQTGVASAISRKKKRWKLLTYYRSMKRSGRTEATYTHKCKTHHCGCCQHWWTWANRVNRWYFSRWRQIYLPWIQNRVQKGLYPVNRSHSW